MTFSKVMSKYNIKEIGSSNIYIIEDAFDQKICNDLIEYINKSELDYLIFSDTNNVQCYNVKNIEVNDMNTGIRNKTEELLMEITKYNNRIKVIGQTMFELRKVYGETRLHQDGIFDIPIEIQENIKIKSVRSLTLVITLNDDYEGGLYMFPNQNITIKPKRGTAILFPPYYTHVHSVTRIETGKFRYICSSWGLDEFVKKNDTKDINKKVLWKYKNFVIE